MMLVCRTMIQQLQLVSSYFAYRYSSAAPSKTINKITKISRGETTGSVRELVSRVVHRHNSSAGRVQFPDSPEQQQSLIILGLRTQCTMRRLQE